MKKVLVADDYSSVRVLIRAVLEKAGYSVFEASDGKEAVRNARRFLPDLIILDLDLPGSGGLGTFQELRRDQRFSATPIVAFTAIPVDRERALSAGFTGCVAKPVSLNELRSETERLLGAVPACVSSR